MNRYLKAFLRRGLIFGGFGPIVTGIVFFIISLSLEDFSLGGSEFLLAIFSTYLLAFVHAGASIFNQIEHWPIAKSLFFHFLSLYLAYTLCYLANAWIPFHWITILIFTAVFAAIYFVVWITVYLSVRAVQKRLNQRLKS